MPGVENTVGGEKVSIGRLTLANGFAFTFPGGSTDSSNVFDGRGFADFGLQVGSVAMVGTSFNFLVSWDNVTFVVLRDKNNTAVAITTSASASLAYEVPSQLFPWPFWKLRSGSNEGATFVVYIVAKG